MPELPLVAVIDWKDYPQSEPEVLIESKILEGVAHAGHFPCNSGEDFTDEIYEAEALILWHNVPLRARDLQRLKRCRAVIRNGVGFDSVDIDAAAKAGIAVCNVPDYGTEEVADHALSLALALCRQLFPLDREAKQLRWTIVNPERLRRIRNRCFGIVGLGRIGTAAALRAKAFGFRVLFYDPYLPSGVHKSLGIERAHSLEDLLRAADVLSVHCPLNPETHHLIGRKELTWMKPDAFLVNTARGAIVEKAPLLEALREGRLGGAGLDVVEDEPLREEEEAVTPNLIVTCHSAFCSVESKIEMRNSSARTAREAVLGNPPPNRVN